MLAPWKESCDKPRQHIKKQRHYLPTKVCLVKAMVFPVVMYGCESWIIISFTILWLKQVKMTITFPALNDLEEVGQHYKSSGYEK